MVLKVIFSAYYYHVPVIILSLFKEEGVYCFDYVSQSIDQVVYDQQLENSLARLTKLGMMVSLDQ